MALRTAQAYPRPQRLKNGLMYRSDAVYLGPTAKKTTKAHSRRQHLADDLIYPSNGAYLGPNGWNKAQYIYLATVLRQRTGTHSIGQKKHARTHNRKRVCYRGKGVEYEYQQHRRFRKHLPERRQGVPLTSNQALVTIVPPYHCLRTETLR